ncbi:unnamed protein product [Dovyalis caffra]|uniref:Uncharacterized protein n=1 Tax=Dovyalis caffra TaxID=77055 RepID=A0AAV1RL44_9ROSI|nr:unnamed protein product [Dovyalis caffra]
MLPNKEKTEVRDALKVFGLGSFLILIEEREPEEWDESYRDSIVLRGKVPYKTGMDVQNAYYRRRGLMNE